MKRKSLNSFSYFVSVLEQSHEIYQKSKQRKKLLPVKKTKTNLLSPRDSGLSSVFYREKQDKRLTNLGKEN